MTFTAAIHTAVIRALAGVLCPLLDRWPSSELFNAGVKHGRSLATTSDGAGPAGSSRP